MLKIKLVAVNGRYTHSCAALYYLRNALEHHLPGCVPELLQFSLSDPYYQTLLRIAANGPDVVCFSVYVWSSAFIGRLVTDLARLLPATAMVLGGPQAPTLAATLPSGCCAVVAGEVEGLDEVFFGDLAAGRLRAAYRAEAGHPFRMPYREEDFTSGLRHRQIYYESSRGCPFACSYCLSAVSRGVRQLELDQVRAELGVLLAQGPAVVRFVDRTFNADPERTLALWRFLVAQPGDTVFHFEIAPGLFTEEMFAFLATVPAGRFRFEIGLQSTNPATLAAINRRADFGRIRANVGRLRAAANIHLHLDLILGLPFEDEASFRRSLADAFSLAPHYLQVGLLKVLPDTPLRREAERFGILACEAPPYEVLATGSLDHAGLARLHWLGECVEAFHNNRFFVGFFAYLRRVEPDPARVFTELLDLCRAEDFFARARTQQLMNHILLAWAASRSDGELVAELLCFDWLRSGHRFLPPEFDAAPLATARDRLYHALPDELAPFFTARDRNRFFKKSLFLDCSAPLLGATGLGDGGRAATLCFPADRPPEGVLGLQPAVLLPHDAVFL